MDSSETNIDHPHTDGYEYSIDAADKLLLLQEKVMPCTFTNMSFRHYNTFILMSKA